MDQAGASSLSTNLRVEVLSVLQGQLTDEISDCPEVRSMQLEMVKRKFMANFKVMEQLFAEFRHEEYMAAHQIHLELFQLFQEIIRYRSN